MAIGYLPQEEPDAIEVIELINAAGRKAVALPGDIRDEAFCIKLVEDGRQGVGRSGHSGQQCGEAEISAVYCRHHHRTV